MGEPRIPILCSSRVTLKPGRSVSTTIADSRRLVRSASGLVTANTTTRSATLAWLMNRLPPSMTYSSPSRTAFVRMPDGSDPASASVRANAMSRSPEASPGSQRSCCSGEPATWIGIAPSDCTARIRPDVAHARLICSIARHRVSRSAPRPPCRSANGIARMSWLARSRRTSSGHSAVRSMSAARGAICSSASSRTASRRRTWSSVRRIEPWARSLVVTQGPC